MFRKLTEHSKTILYSHPHVAMFMAGFVFFLYRMFFLPGFNFNARLWDEEIGWEKDFRQRGFFEWLTYRDAPGYFVFLPRLILSACHLVPISIGSDNSPSNFNIDKPYLCLFRCKSFE